MAFIKGLKATLIYPDRLAETARSAAFPVLHLNPKHREATEINHTHTSYFTPEGLNTGM